MNKNSRGFTLIELIVVITIIGILSSIVGISINGVQQKARDKRRKDDVAQIQNALVLYKVKNGKYPEFVSSGGANIKKLTGLSTSLTSASNKFLASIPLDPSNKNNCPAYLYLHNDNRDAYTLLVMFENTNNPEAIAKKTPPVETGGTIGTCRKDDPGDTGPPNENCRRFRIHNGRDCELLEYNYWVNSPN